MNEKQRVTTRNSILRLGLTYAFNPFIFLLYTRYDVRLTYLLQSKMFILIFNLVYCIICHVKLKDELNYVQRDIPFFV